jgi:glycosyltransferase involved in cell wall biosynthesis
MIWKARSRGILVLFDVDDLVFDFRFVNLLVDSLDQDITNPQVWDSWFAYVTRLGRVLELCSGVIVTNPYLADMAKAFSGKPVSIVPNFMNREQLDISDRMFEEKKRSGFAREHEFRIGYFSGTPTHNKDLQVAAAALERILDRYPHVKVRLAGFMDVKKHFPTHADRVEFIPFQNFINLQRSIGECEVNLAPLQDNLFTNCKSELKYFEAAVVGTVTVATPTFTLAKAIEHTRDGFLAKSFEWESRLDEIVRTFDSLDDVLIHARETCRGKYGWFNQWSVIENAIEELKTT